MTKKEIDKLISDGEFPEATHQRILIETHASWVILCDAFVYKIKKPLKFSFLDFSTLELRKHFCERELELNRRFSKNIYLDVLPVYQSDSGFSIGINGNSPIDYALKMRKLDPKKQMDLLIADDKVNKKDIENLAKSIVDFHKNTKIIHNEDRIDDGENFNDLGSETDFISRKLGSQYGEMIDRAIKVSDIFLYENKKLLFDRLDSGLFRDCHGDLHTRNIFLLPKPQLFDCIEFNDEYREIDVLNDVAFLCMDLDALNRNDLSNHFIDTYNLLFPTMKTEKEQKLFIYYKSYRANIRAKVSSLRARNVDSDSNRNEAFTEVKKYLSLMDNYLQNLESKL